MCAFFCDNVLFECVARLTHGIKGYLSNVIRTPSWYANWQDAKVEKYSTKTPHMMNRYEARGNTKGQDRGVYCPFTPNQKWTTTTISKNTKLTSSIFLTISRKRLVNASLLRFSKLCPVCAPFSFCFMTLNVLSWSCFALRERERGWEQSRTRRWVRICHRVLVERTTRTVSENESKNVWVCRVLFRTCALGRRLICCRCPTWLW